MIVTFQDKATRDIACAENTKEARRCLPRGLHRRATRVLSLLEAAEELEDFELPGYRSEKLRGDRAGQWSLRINQQYRVCFVWKDGKAYDVAIVDYH